MNQKKIEQKFHYVLILLLLFSWTIQLPIIKRKELTHLKESIEKLIKDYEERKNKTILFELKNKTEILKKLTVPFSEQRAVEHLLESAEEILIQLILPTKKQKSLFNRRKEEDSSDEIVLTNKLDEDKNEILSNEETFTVIAPPQALKSVEKKIIFPSKPPSPQKKKNYEQTAKVKFEIQNLKKEIHVFFLNIEHLNKKEKKMYYELFLQEEGLILKEIMFLPFSKEREALKSELKLEIKNLKEQIITHEKEYLHEEEDETEYMKTYEEKVIKEKARYNRIDYFYEEALKKKNNQLEKLNHLLKETYKFIEELYFTEPFKKTERVLYTLLEKLALKIETSIYNIKLEAGIFEEKTKEEFIRYQSKLENIKKSFNNFLFYFNKIVEEETNMEEELTLLKKHLENECFNIEYLNFISESPLYAMRFKNLLMMIEKTMKECLSDSIEIKHSPIIKETSDVYKTPEEANETASFDFNRENVFKKFLSGSSDEKSTAVSVEKMFTNTNFYLELFQNVLKLVSVFEKIYLEENKLEEYLLLLDQYNYLSESEENLKIEFEKSSETKKSINEELYLQLINLKLQENLDLRFAIKNFLIKKKWIIEEVKKRIENIVEEKTVESDPDYKYKRIPRDYLSDERRVFKIIERPQIPDLTRNFGRTGKPALEAYKHLHKLTEEVNLVFKNSDKYLEAFQTAIRAFRLLRLFKEKQERIHYLTLLLKNVETIKNCDSKLESEFESIYRNQVEKADNKHDIKIEMILQKLQEITDLRASIKQFLYNEERELTKYEELYLFLDHSSLEKTQKSYQKKEEFKKSNEKRYKKYTKNSFDEKKELRTSVKKSNKDNYISKRIENLFIETDFWGKKFRKTQEEFETFKRNRNNKYEKHELYAFLENFKELSQSARPLFSEYKHFAAIFSSEKERYLKIELDTMRTKMEENIGLKKQIDTYLYNNEQEIVRIEKRITNL